MYKKTLLIDFDGVIHSYTSPWTGVDEVSDPPVPGAFEFLEEVIDIYDTCIYSSRSKKEEGVEAMREWLLLYGLPIEVLDKIRFPVEKPAAYLTIDDRCICFKGVFPAVHELNDFTPWNKKV